MDKNKRIINDPTIKSILAPHGATYTRVKGTNQWFLYFPHVISHKDMDEVERKIQARVEELEKEIEG